MSKVSAIKPVAEVDRPKEAAKAAVDLIYGMTRTGAEAREAIAMLAEAHNIVMLPAKPAIDRITQN